MCRFLERHRGQICAVFRFLVFGAYVQFSPSRYAEGFSPCVYPPIPASAATPSPSQPWPSVHEPLDAAGICISPDAPLS